MLVVVIMHVVVVMRAVVVTLIENQFAGANAVQAKRVADAMAVESLAIHVAGTLGCDQ